MKFTEFSRTSKIRYAAAAIAAMALATPLLETAANAQESAETAKPAAKKKATAKKAKKTQPKVEEKTEAPKEEPKPETAKAEEKPAEPAPMVLAEVKVETAPKAVETPAPAVAPQAPAPTGKQKTLDNKWDIGGNAIANEAGQSVFGSIRYKELAGFNAGNIWFGPLAAPFASLSFTPELHAGRVGDEWRFKGVYYGKASTLANLPSWFNTSHAVGLGYFQPLDRDERWKLRAGVVGGGAISYPTFDDLYSSFSAGASLQYRGTTFYAAPTFYWAADTPTKTAYYGYYNPKFQDIDMGVQARVFREFVIGGSADVGRLKSTYSVVGARTLALGDEAELTAYIRSGITHWIEELGGRNDWVVSGGIRLTIGGRYGVNSTSSVRFEHYQAGGIPLNVQTDIPTRENPGPYGFGRAGSPAWIESVNTAKARMAQSSDWDSFVGSYGNDSEAQKIAAARFLLGFMAQTAYANNAGNALLQGEVLNPDAKRIAGASHDTIYGYVREYAGWYDNNNGPLPDNLKNGIAICAGAHEMAMDFLNRNGVRATVMSVNTPDGPHTIVMATPESGTYLLDWGSQYSSNPNSWDQLLRFYGQRNGAPTYQSQIFGPDGYMGTYVTPEGRLLHQTVGIYTPIILKREFLGIGF